MREGCVCVLRCGVSAGTREAGSGLGDSWGMWLPDCRADRADRGAALVIGKLWSGSDGTPRALLPVSGTMSDYGRHLLLPFAPPRTSVHYLRVDG